MKKASAVLAARLQADREPVSNVEIKKKFYNFRGIFLFLFIFIMRLPPDVTLSIYNIFAKMLQKFVSCYHGPVSSLVKTY